MPPLAHMALREKLEKGTLILLYIHLLENCCEILIFLISSYRASLSQKFFIINNQQQICESHCVNGVPPHGTLAGRAQTAPTSMTAPSPRLLVTYCSSIQQHHHHHFHCPTHSVMKAVMPRGGFFLLTIISMTFFPSKTCSPNISPCTGLYMLLFEKSVAESSPTSQTDILR